MNPAGNISGIRQGNECLTFFPRDAKIRPLRDQIFLEPLDYKPSQILPIVYSGRTVRGVVRAIGPGVYPIKYNGPKGQRTKSWNSKTFRPTTAKVGDTVELGGIELGGYLFQTIMWGGKEIVVCREEDIVGIIDKP